jgi:murein DD-endopeptidase MepM/ murein hydrolase activator NlpD
LLLAGCNFSGRPSSAPTPSSPTAAAAVAPAAGTPQPGVYSAFPGDTVYGVAQRFGVPVRTLIETNALKPPYRLVAGQQLRVPVRQEHVVQAGDNLLAISRIYGVDQSSLARANDLQPPYGLKPGQRLILPGRIDANLAALPLQPGAAATHPEVGAAGTMSVEELPPPVATSSTAAPAAPSVQPAEPVDAPATPPTPPAAPAVPSEPAMTSEPVVSAEPTEKPAATPPAEEPDVAALPDTTDMTPRSSGRFLWPVEGKVVSRFGAKKGGLHNDGINIAAVAGANVVAAQDGVVAYAGNELRGFGNLLLVRHANGWVTAYAHNEKLLVKQGDKVRRGQPIARVGSTGNVTSPQLHFEIRKGTDPVDPLEHLAVQGVDLSSADVPAARPDPE